MSTHTKEGRESDGTYFFCVKDKEGHLNHTTVAMDEEYSIELFLNVENAMLCLTNARRTHNRQEPIFGKSWSNARPKDSAS